MCISGEEVRRSRRKARQNRNAAGPSKRRKKSSFKLHLRRSATPASDADGHLSETDNEPSEAEFSDAEKSDADFDESDGEGDKMTTKGKHTIQLGKRKKAVLKKGRQLHLNRRLCIRIL